MGIFLYYFYIPVFIFHEVACVTVIFMIILLLHNLYSKASAFGVINSSYPISDPYGLSAILIIFSYSSNQGYIGTVMHCEISDIYQQIF